MGNAGSYRNQETNQSLKQIFWMDFFELGNNHKYILIAMILLFL